MTMRGTMKTERRTDLTGQLGFGMLITAVGGMMDAYSYGMRGQVFATGQTGNFVLVAVRLVEGEYRSMLQALVPIVSFWVGVFLAKHLLHRVLGEDSVRWRRNVLLMEMGLLFLVGWIPESAPHIYSNTVISLTAAMQFCCFRNFGENAAYATVFCTGNMRSCAEMYYQGLVLKDRESLRKANGYGGILLSFFAGACVGFWAGGFMGEKSIWCACGLLAAAVGALVWEKRRK